MTDLPVWLQGIRDRANKATKGPWETGKTYEYELVRDKSWRGRYPFRVGECAACSKGALVRQDDVHTFGQGHVHVVEDERLWYVVSSAGAQRDVAGKDRSGVPAQFAQHGVHYAEDADFIAHSRADVPQLVELVAEMAEQLECLIPRGCDIECEDCMRRERERYDRCDRQAVLRMLAKYRGEVENNG